MIMFGWVLCIVSMFLGVVISIMVWIFLLLVFFSRLMVVIIELLVVSIGLMISECCLVMFGVSFFRQVCVFRVFLLWVMLIVLILVLGIRLSMLLSMLMLVCRIGIMVIFFLEIFFIVIGLVYLGILYCFRGRFLVVLQVSRVLIFWVSLWKFLVLILVWCIRFSLWWMRGWWILCMGMGDCF